MGLQSKYIWMNGKMVEFDKATVHFLTPTLHYGAGVFEGIRCYNTENGPAVFRLKEHVKRLFDSAYIFGCRELPYTETQVAEAIKQTVAVNNFKACYIRPLIYFTGDALGLNMDVFQTNLGIAAWEWDSYLGEEALEKGIRAKISSFTRHHPNVTMTKAKTAGNYSNSYLAKSEAVRLGFDEAIMLDPQGYVSECTGENLFVIRKGKLYTPPTSAILEGITRDALITLARDLGYEVVEQLLSRDHLYIADEVFVCGTAAECVPVCEIDFHVIGAGKRGPITHALQKEFQTVIRGQHARSAEWLDPVDTKVTLPADAVKLA
ncbi:MAG: branched-chain amino acid transaminase [Chloroflexi bacterium]|nr:branched-chain amino acid transaminase [Chloroflexota bacterium]